MYENVNIIIPKGASVKMQVKKMTAHILKKNGEQISVISMKFPDYDKTLDAYNFFKLQLEKNNIKQFSHD